MKVHNVNLTIVGEVFISASGNHTVDRSFNAILRAYRKYVSTLHYVGPSLHSSPISAHHSQELDTSFSSIPEYNKSMTGRLSGLFQKKKIANRILSLCESLHTSLFQIRLPAVLPLSLTPSLLASSIPVSFYLSGNWKQSLCASYPYPLVPFLANKLSQYERSLLLQAPIISAGTALGRDLSLPNTIPYFSTTHEKITPIDRIRDGKRLLYVGRIEPQKRLEDLLDAVALLQETLPDIQLSVVGDGKHKTSCMKRANDKSISHLISWHGKIDDLNTLEQLYASSDVLILPSLSEGSPKVLPEAMSFGIVPIGVSNAGSVPDIISDQQNGILVPPRTPHAIAVAIQKLVNDPQYRQRLTDNAYSYAQDHTLSAEVSRAFGVLLSKHFM